MRHRTTRADAHALTLALAALAVTAGTSCKGGDSGPDCKAVGAAYASLQRQEIEKPSGAAATGATSATAQQKEQALSLIPLVKEAIVKECEAKKWGAEARRCAVAARTPDDLERCRTRPEAVEAEGAEEADQAGEQQPAPGQEGEPPPAKAPAAAPQPEKSDSP